MPLVFGAQTVTPSLRGQPTNVIELQAGNCQLIPAGAWMVRSGKYTVVQEYDPVAGFWRQSGSGGLGDANMQFVQSDGVNFRVANQSGCVVGVMVTTAGAGYTSAPTITTSGTSAAVFAPIIGGAVNSTVTVTNGGTGYVYPPLVLFSAPPTPGIQATGYCTLSGSVVSTVTVVDQGAGYASAPTISLVNDPRDSTGYGASATSTLTGSGTITGILVTDFGNPVTSLPTLTFTGGGYTSTAAGFPIMCWTITAYTVNSAGSGYVDAVEVTGLLGPFPQTATSNTNPTTNLNLVKLRRASIRAALSGGAITATGQSVYDGGIYPVAPAMGILAGVAGTSASVGSLSATMGGANDVVLLFAA